MDTKYQVNDDGLSSENEQKEHFIQKRNKRTSRPPRPLSLASQIISNPKLVKSLQDLGECRNLQRHFSVARIDIKGKDAFAIEEAPLEVSGFKRYLGILLALFASLVLSLSSIIVKSISDEYHPYSISVWTFQGMFLPSIVILLYHKFANKQQVFHGVVPLCSQVSFKNQFLLLVRNFHLYKSPLTLEDTHLLKTSYIFI
jgi:hypothetical protein